MVKESVTNADFGTGLLAGFAVIGVKKLSTARLDGAAMKAFELLETFPDVDLRFHMMTHPLHGDVPEARRAIGGAAARGLGYFDSDGILHLELTKNEAPLYFENLPLGEEQWKNLAVKALAYLKGE